MNAIAELVRIWGKFELGMEPPPPLDFGKVADEIDRLDGLVREALELLEWTHKRAVPMEQHSLGRLSGDFARRLGTLSGLPDAGQCVT